MDIRLLIGMIASGKSTYAKRQADLGAVVIAHDDLTAMFHASYRYEQGLRQLYREAEEALAGLALVHGKKVVVDRTHLTRESRERWVKFARDLGVTITAVVFPVASPDVHAYRRFHHNGRGRGFEAWLRVASHHYNQARAEPFDASAEGFDSTIIIQPTAFDGA